jgi:serine/threonine protein kinase
MDSVGQIRPPVDSDLPVPIGGTLDGKYRLERVLGQGGMGVVVAARHLALGERVAVKFLLPKFAADPAVVARFVGEGRAAVRIRSEHVARVLDVGTMSDGGPFLVMEYLHGPNLQQVIRAGAKVSVAHAVDLVLQACEAIAEAHSMGIVHRDLKPSNLVLTERPDGSACLKVIDFGISKIRPLSDRAAFENSAEGTSSSMMLGSPHYMAPEQMRSPRDVDARADIWSLGCILFALLDGAPPFRGDTAMAVFERILEGVPPLSRFEAPPGLVAALNQALAKDPDRRFMDINAFSSALCPFASSQGQRSVEWVRALVARSGAPLGRGETAIRSASSTASATRLSRKDRTSAEPTAGSIEVPVGKEGGLSHRRLALIAAALAAIALAAVALMRPRRPEPSPRAAARSAQGPTPAEPPRAAPEPAASPSLGAKPEGKALSSEQQKAEQQLAEGGAPPAAEPEASTAKAPSISPALPPSSAKQKPARPVERQRPTVDLFTEPQ